MPEAYARMSDGDLLGRLAKMSATSGKAAMAYAALTDDDWFFAISELRRRFSRRATEVLAAREDGVTRSGRMRSASTCEIDPARWKGYWFSQRTRLSQVGPSIGLGSNWASTIACKKQASYHALDRLACALEVSTDDLVWAVSTDRERERVELIG